jgi:hypothetical protein
MSDTRDWWAWHEPYDDPSSGLAQRLRIVQRRIRDTLDHAPPGPLHAVSLCAGQGRDLLGVLADHPRRHDVTARLVELDDRNVAAARAALASLDLPDVTVVPGDAGLTDSYAGAVPADLVLACGIFGNITEDDIRRTVAGLPELCAAGATVIWTRHRLPPDLTGPIRQWFDAEQFDEVGFDTVEDAPFSVGTHRFHGVPPSLAPGRRLFCFVDPSEGR